MPAPSLLKRLSAELAALVERVLPCVVSLAAPAEGGEVSGSGFLLDDDGHIVTNWHVVDGVGNVMHASTPGGQRQEATLVGTDVITDLAVLRLTEPVRHHLTLRAQAARLGELCMALGSPLGIYPESVSLGVVSGLARTIPQPGSRPIERAIQTDAAINPGNSGGPLVDVDGHVIGVNKCIDNRGTGLGFAIPADTVRSVSAELIESGVVTRAALGVTVVNQAVSVRGAELMRLVVTRVGGSKQFEVGDVILEIDGHDIDERSDLYDHLTKDHIGKPLRVVVLRANRRRTLSLKPTKLG
jgi:S1-C subfamily serine protease